MCLFPTRAPMESPAYKKGVEFFNCGSCPECLKTRAGMWALRAVYEAKYHKHSLMITLTYDNYLRDDKGRIIGEQVADRRVDVSDCQKFIKRVRKHFDEFGIKIKYIIAAEYGKRTHRPHYHVLLFGAWFDDIVFYKKSRRGNPIFKSETLTKLWGKGICTIDKKNVTSSAARYCTKYLAKDKGAEDTFQLFSHGLGVVPLLADFNGLYYLVEGRKYPIPRAVWQKYIEEKYPQYNVSFRYVNLPKDDDPLYNEKMRQYYLAKALRDCSTALMDSDPVRQSYIAYWKERIEQANENRLPVLDRIALLPDDKYFAYKVRARAVYELRHRGVPYPAPRSGQRSAYINWLLKRRFINSEKDVEHINFGNTPFCRCASRLATANDTTETGDQRNIRVWRQFEAAKRSASRATIADLKNFDDIF